MRSLDKYLADLAPEQHDKPGQCNHDSPGCNGRADFTNGGE